MQKSSYEALRAQIAELEREAEALFQEEKAAAISSMKVEIAKYSITATDLGLRLSGPAPAKQAKTSPSVKYRNHETGDEWSGRGPAPKWLKEQIAGGKSKEYFLVPQ
ncbi:H-NS histone family protein [Pandoraea soli]|uniref:H-NS histone family protein n=1 Tax=Pandoraea soli TaxID=2508293 RepID=UPI00158209D0|nr:H-NS histone family protein [Pandoraea soli]